MKALTKEIRDAITPSQAIDMLKKGNQRFVSKTPLKRDLMEQVSDTAAGQYPFAVILSCVDSRTSSELIFDLGIGDAFNARIAGNIQNVDILGSMEFTCKLAGAKLIAVIGHTKCGAIKGACDNAKLGNLTTLLDKMKPAIDAEKSVKDNRTSSNADFVEKVSTLNVRITMQQILQNSPTLKAMVDAGEIALVGGMYDIETGIVNFYDKDTVSA